MQLLTLFIVRCEVVTEQGHFAGVKKKIMEGESDQKSRIHLKVNNASQEEHSTVLFMLPVL